MFINGPFNFICMVFGENFTKNSKLANKQVDEYLDKICSFLRKNVSGLISIYLAGSFGYGEGPVKFEKGKIYPFNDFDIYLVTKKKIDADKVDQFASKAVGLIGYKGIDYFYSFKKSEQKLKSNFYLDLKAYTVKELKKLLPRLRTLQFKYDSKLLYGSDVRYLIPSYKIGQVPKSEPAKLLLDRMSQLLEYYSVNGEHCDDYLTYIIQQAYVACLTSLLVSVDKYKPTYSLASETLFACYKEDFPELYKKEPFLAKRIKLFVDWRLKPNKLPVKSVKKAWFRVVKDITVVTIYYYSYFLKKKINDVSDLSSAISKMFKTYYTPYLVMLVKKKTVLPFLLLFLNIFFRYKYFIRMWGKFSILFPKIFFNKRSPDLVIFSAVPFLLNSLNEDHSLNRKLFFKGRNLLKKVYPVKSKNWEEMSLEYANAYIAFYMQKL